MSGVLINRTQYKVELVEETTPPEGLEGGNWFRYVVGEGKARIEGKKPGTLASVKKHAEQFAKELNELKQSVQDALTAKKDTLQDVALMEAMKAEKIDVTRFAPKRERGALHPVMEVMDEIIEFVATEMESDLSHLDRSMFASSRMFRNIQSSLILLFRASVHPLSMQISLNKKDV